VLKGRTENGVEEGYHENDGVRFASSDGDRVMVSFHHLEDWALLGSIEYQHMADGTWTEIQQTEGVPEVGTALIDDLSEVEHLGLYISLKQWLNEPPRLIATYKQKSRVIWDPNPQLKNVEMGQASVYRWKDGEGKEWNGGLYKPTNYMPGRRYPLVIQTHGFNESLFEPSGFVTTAFAARALAAAGIVVLQVRENCILRTPSEGPCAASGYESASNQLISEGLVDPEKIGIIGFSGTCYYVMEALTTRALHLKAASITDGTTTGYFEYLLMEGGVLVDDSNPLPTLIGAQPFGEGLQLWLKRSPEFNLSKVTAPLLIVGGSPPSLLGMWEPYAGLRYLHKPVDLVMLNADEHVLTNPAMRMASQGGSVDWFRFWLQDYEDPDPTKASQYKRWRELRQMQAENDKKAAAVPLVSDVH
jgi:dipeptidyl aminopeptidase/acylaminoacyl peptidase